jgi:catechol 2,3-dioxygenase-like lactoylglutathione lyase family enzyme
VSVEVIGIDHIYLAVRDPRKAEEFYDLLMDILGFRKNQDLVAGEPHVHYFNRQLGFTLRPARGNSPDHDPYAPGLHHLCFRVLDPAAVDRAVAELRAAGIEVTDSQFYPEYAPDYYATFFSDPDGIRLEISNFWERRRKRMYDWDGEGTT